MKTLREVVRVVLARFIDQWRRGDPEPRIRERDGNNELPVPVRVDSATGSNPESLAFIYEDVRRVLDHQVEYLSDVGEKALRTVRITAVLLGIVLSVRQLSVRPSLTDPVPEVAALFFLGSIAIGVLTYATSDPQFGPGPRYIDEVLDDPASESYWRSETLRSYADWIEDNEELSRRNGSYLLASQFLLLLGLATITVGIGITIAVT